MDKQKTYTFADRTAVQKLIPGTKRRRELHQMKREIMEGRSFGKWEVLSYDGCYAHKKSFYLCRCGGCGEIHRVRADRLKAGKSTQCFNCARRQNRKAAAR